MTVNRTYEQIVREIRPWVASHTIGPAPSHESAWRSNTPAAHSGSAHDAPHHHRADRHHRVIAGQGDAPHRRLGRHRRRDHGGHRARVSGGRLRRGPRPHPRLGELEPRDTATTAPTAPGQRAAGPPRPASEARNRAMGHKPPAMPKHDRRITRVTALDAGNASSPVLVRGYPSGDRRRQAIRRAVDEPGRSRSPRRPRPGGRGRTECVRRIDYLFWPGARSDGLPVASRQADAPV